MSPSLPSGRAASRRITRRSRRQYLVAAIVLAGCGGESAPSAPPVPQTPAVAAVNVDPSSVTVRGIGGDATVSASVAPTGAVGTIAWRSADPSIATVAGAGGSATIRAVAAGATRVIASVGTIENAVNVTIIPIARRITVASGTASIRVGTSATLSATVEADVGASTAVQWTSATPAVATVDSLGVVRGVSPGTSVITASSVATPSIAATITVSVGYPTVTLTVSPTVVSMLPATTRQLSAVVTAEAGALTTVTWTSSAPAVASVNATGLVTSIAVGSANITATSTSNPGVSATASITVTAPVVRAITVSGARAVMAGDTLRLSARVDADPGADTAYTWRSSDTTIATVGAVTGLVQTRRVGSATITAALVRGSVSGSQIISPSAPRFSLQWTETNDGVIDPISGVGAVLNVVRLPDGRTVGATDAPGKYVERSTGGTWSVRSLLVSSVVPFVRTTRSGALWALSSGGVVLRQVGSTWVTDTTLAVTAAAEFAVADDGHAMVVAADRRVFVRGTDGRWTLLPPAPIVFPFMIVTGASMSATGPAIVLTLSETNATANSFSGVFSVVAWTGSAWKDMVRPAGYTSLIRGGAPLLLDDGTVLLGAGANVFTFSVFRATLGSTDWSREYADPVQTTNPGGFPFTRCTDGTVITRFANGEVFARSGGAWSSVLPNSRNGIPPAVSFACATPTDVVTTDGSGVLARIVAGPIATFERVRLNLSRVSVGGSTNILATTMGAGAVLQYDGVQWSAIAVPVTGSDITGSPGVTAWGAAGGLISSVDRVARRNGATWSWESRTVPAYGGFSLDGSTIYLFGNEARPIYFGASAYGSGLQRWLNSSLTDLTPSFSAFSEMTGGGDGSIVAASGKRWVRASGVTTRVDSLPEGQSISHLSTTAANYLYLTSFNRFNLVSRQYEIPVYCYTDAGYRDVHIPEESNTESVTALVARSLSEVYAFTSTKRILGFDGVEWRVIGSTTNIVRAVQLRGDIAVAVGDNGTVVYGRSIGAAATVGRSPIRLRRRE